MKRNLALIIILFSGIIVFSQEVKTKKIYTIADGEKVIMANEHKLLILQDETKHILFLDNNGSKYVLYNEKKYGPFQEIQEWESKAGLLDWAVKKDNKWYQLFLDFDKFVGPFDEVVDVYRDNSGKHYGFRAKIDTSWFAVIDDKRFGPYSRMTSGYPKFSPLANNWMYEYTKNVNGKEEDFIKFKNEEINQNDMTYLYFNIDLQEDGYDYVKVKSKVIKYRAYGWSSSGSGDISYYSKNHFGFKENDQWEKAGGMSSSHPNISSTNVSGKNIWILDTEEKYLLNRKGNITGPFNEIYRFGIDNGKSFAIVKNYLVNKSGSYVPIYSNIENYNNPPESPVKRVKNIWIGNKCYGPYEDIEGYSLQISKNGDFVCIVMPDNQLVFTGKLTGITNVKNVFYSYISGSYIAITKNGEVWFNNKKIGEFTIEKYWNDIKISDDGKNFAFLYKKGEESYIYLSALNKSAGPVNLTKGSLEWEVSRDFKHVAYNTGSVTIDGKQDIDKDAFSLVYSKKTNSFCWLVLSGRDIYKKEINLP